MVVRYFCLAVHCSVRAPMLVRPNCSHRTLLALTLMLYWRACQRVLRVPRHVNHCYAVQSGESLPSGYIYVYSLRKYIRCSRRLSQWFESTWLAEAALCGRRELANHTNKDYQRSKLHNRHFVSLIRFRMWGTRRGKKL